MDHREAERKVEEGTKEGDKGHGRRPRGTLRRHLSAEVILDEHAISSLRSSVFMGSCGAAGNLESAYAIDRDRTLI